MQENLYTLNSKRNNFLYIIKFTIFLLLFLPFIIYFGNIYKKINSLNQINIYNKKRFDCFYSTPKNTIDLVFIGSSHSYCTFDPEIFDNNLNINSFQMGMPLQHPDNSYYTLLEILNYQKPSIVVMEIYWDVLTNDFDIKQTDMLFQVLKNDNLKKDFFKNVFPLNEKIKYIIPVIRYQQDYFSYKNKEIKNKIEKFFNVSENVEVIEGTEYVTNKGFIYSDYIIPKNKYNKNNQFNNFDASKYKLSSKQILYLEKIIKTCKNKDINLFFVTSPIAPISMEKIKNYSFINRTISDFSKKYGIEYLDYNINKDIFLSNKNFRDDAHLNYSGSIIISNHFSNWLINLIDNKKV